MTVPDDHRTDDDLIDDGRRTDDDLIGDGRQTGGHQSGGHQTDGGHQRAGPLFWVSAAAGWVVIGIGLRGIVIHRFDTRPANLAKFVVGGALLHDLLIAPLVLLAAVALVRVLPDRTRAPVQAALVVTGVLALFSYPLVRAYGLAANNPTSLPHNYAANLTIVLGVVWAAAAAAMVVRLRKRRRASVPMA